MTFTELLTEVYNLTIRPDLVAMTKSAVKAATLKAHQSDFYAKDLYEAQFTFPSSEFIQVFDFFSFMPKYRALKYLRKYNTADNTAGDFICLVTPEELLDEWNRERTNVCYVAGNVINIKSDTEFTDMIVSAYLSPDVTELNYSSWIAELYPYAIVHEAARVVFGTIAQQAEASAQQRFVAEQYAELKINATIEQGY